MPTVIDSLIISLGMDSSDFDRGAKEAARSFLKMRDEAVHHAKEIEKEVGEKLSESFKEAIRHVIEFIAALAAADSIREFAASTMEAGVGLKSMSESLGMSGPQLSAIQNAIEGVEGSAASAGASLKRLNDLRIAYGQGQPPSREEGVLGIDPLAARNGLDMMRQAVQGLDRLKITNVAQRAWHLQQLGVDAGTAHYFASRSWRDAQGEFGEARGTAWTNPQIEAANNIHKAWDELQKTIQSVGRDIFTFAEKPLTSLMEHLKKVVDENKELVSGWFGDRVKGVDDWLTSEQGKKDRAELVKDLGLIAGAANAAKDALGGWEHAIEALFALWLGGKALRVAGSISAIMGALGGGGAGGGIVSALFTYGRLMLLGIGAIGIMDASSGRDPTRAGTQYFAGMGDTGNTPEGRASRGLADLYGGGAAAGSLIGGHIGGMSPAERLHRALNPLDDPSSDAATLLRRGHTSSARGTEITIDGGRTISRTSPMPVYIVGLQSVFSASGMAGADAGRMIGQSYAAGGGRSGAGSGALRSRGSGGAHDLVGGTTDFSGLKVRGDAVAGGPVTEGLLDLARHQQQAEGGYFTALNDAYHHHIGYHSAHTEGRAFDEIVPGGDYDAARRRVNDYLLKAGMDPKDFWIEPGTGNHLHVQFNSAAAAQKYADKIKRATEGAPRVGPAASPSLITGPQSMRQSTNSVTVGQLHINAGGTGTATSGIEQKMRASLRALRADVGLV